MSKPVTYRLEEELVAEIKNFKQRKSKELGFNLSETDAVRSLLRSGIAKEKEKAEV